MIAEFFGRGLKLVGFSLLVAHSGSASQVGGGNETGEIDIEDQDYPLLPSEVFFPHPDGEGWNHGITSLKIEGPFNLDELANDNPAYENLEKEIHDLAYGGSYRSDEVPLIPGGIYEFSYTVIDPWHSSYGGESIAILHFLGGSPVADNEGLVVATLAHFPPDPDPERHRVGARVKLLKVDVEEVYETDQVWNKVPNPRQPNYANEFSEPATPLSDIELNNRLFIAIEPNSSKIEISVEIEDRMADAIVGRFLSGVRNQNTGILINEFATFENPSDVSQSSVSELSFTPAGSGEDIVYEVIVGLDSDNDGALAQSEILELGGTPFALSALTGSDISDALSSPAFVGGRTVLIAKDMIAYFLGDSSTVGEASLTGSIPHPITDKAIIMIAGSDYDQETGETDIPEFHANSSSSYADILVNFFSADASRGLYQLVQRTWSRHATEIWNHFEDTGDTEKLFTYQIHEDDSSLNFYYEFGFGLNPPRLALGNAKASGGTVSLNLYRDGDRIYANFISFNTTVEDTYDFDFTRPESSASRDGAIIQVSYDEARNQGRIFHLGVDVSATFNDTTEFDTFPDPLEFFNLNSYIENGQVISVQDAGSGSE